MSKRHERENTAIHEHGFKDDAVRHVHGGGVVAYRAWVSQSVNVDR